MIRVAVRSTSNLNGVSAKQKNLSYSTVNKADRGDFLLLVVRMCAIMTL